MWIKKPILLTLWTLILFITNIAADKKNGMIYYILPGKHLEEHFFQHPESLSPEEARQILAHMVGVSKFYKLGFQSQAIKVLDKFGSLDTEGLWEEKKNHMLITLACVTDPKMFFTQHPFFVIENSPAFEAYNHLIKRFLNQYHELTNLNIEHLYANRYGGGLFLVPPIEGIHNNIQHSPSLIMFENKFSKKNNGVFNFNHQEDRSFLSEILSFDSFIDALSESPYLSSTRLMTAHLTSLEMIYDHYGRYSIQYISAMKAFSETINKIQKILPNVTLTVILLPPTPVTKDPLLRRSKIENVFGSDHSAPVLRNIKDMHPRCYSSKANCEKLTNYCSNHGTCEKYLEQDGCYVCRCSTATNVTESGKKTHWSGDLCEKRDISSEFQMFFWTILFFIIIIIWTIKLLYDTGNEELGAILMNTDIKKM